MRVLRPSRPKRRSTQRSNRSGLISAQFHWGTAFGGQETVFGRGCFGHDHGYALVMASGTEAR